MKVADWPAFIRENTRPLAPPLVPEIILNLASEAVPIWQRTEEELAEMNVPPPFWAFAWAGGQALARYLLDQPDLVAGKSVLDIGSGSGLAAIAAAKAGARRVLAADIDQVAAIAIGLNAAANGTAIEVTADNVLLSPPADWDVVLLGDVFYERALAEAVARFAAAASARGARLFAGDPKRSYFPPDLFDRVAAYEVPVTRELEDAEIKRSTVWEWRRKS